MVGQVPTPVVSQPAVLSQPVVQPAPAAQQALPGQTTPSLAKLAAGRTLLGGFPDPSAISSVDGLLDLGESAAALVSRYVAHAPQGSKS